MSDDDEDDLSKAPIPSVIEQIRAHDFGDHILLGLFLNVLATRLEQEHERANELLELVKPFGQLPVPMTSELLNRCGNVRRYLEKQDG